jgi:hypothetical protein
MLFKNFSCPFEVTSLTFLSPSYRIMRTDGNFDDEYFKGIEESNKFRRKYEMRRMMQVNFLLSVLFFSLFSFCASTRCKNFCLTRPLLGNDIVQDEGLVIIGE